MSKDSTSARDIIAALDAAGMDTYGLSRVGVRPKLGDYLVQLWERRHFIWMDARHRVATQNSRNRLGSVWLVLKPMLEALLYFVIFGLVLHVSRGMHNYPAFVIIGVLMFNPTMRTISQGGNTLQSSRAMIRAFSFPRATLVISAELREAIQLVYSVVAMLIIILLMPPHEFPRLSWLLFPVVFALQSVLDLGIGFIMARIGQSLPDITQVMSFLGRFLMYGSGVIFPVERFLHHPVAMALVNANPIYHLLALYRTILMDGQVPALQHWAVLAGWAFGLLIVGFLFFWRGEASYGRSH